MRYLLATLGSAGDLHPVLALARGLREAGAEVELMSNAPYEDVVRREGVPFRALCSAKDHERTASHPDLWHPMRGFGVLWRHLAVPAIEPVRERILELVAEVGDPRNVRVLASPLAVGARMARAQINIPLCSLYTAPANLRSIANPMFLGAWRVPGWVPPPVRDLLWRGLDRWKLEPMARPLLDRRHAELSLPRPAGSLFGSWIHSPDGGIAMFPASFGASGNPPRGVIETGDFPLFSATGDDSLEDGLAEFVVDGPAPIVIFAGSAGGQHGHELSRRASEACRALGMRAVVLGTGPVGTPTRSDSMTWRCAHAPLGELLPKASAFVHHGGIGSCAQGLHARVPQIISPFAYDQFDNAARVERLGWGTVLPPGQDHPVALLNALQSIGVPGETLLAGAPPEAPGTGLTRVIDAVRRWESRL